MTTNEAAERLRVIHWMTGSSMVRCGFPMRGSRNPEGWDLGTASASLTQVTCPKCLGKKAQS